ncbi:hypothetical protein HRbin06_00334 [archaeon HR06]|nr:hypothetical protein HRbin06_00334 [archaeon HR06]
MGKASLGRWALGIIILILAFFLILSAAQSFRNLQILNVEWIKEVRENLIVASNNNNNNPYLVVRTLLIQPEPFSSSPLVDIPVTLTPKGKGNSTLYGKTGIRGSVVFRVPPGDYIISARYLGLLGNVSLTLPNERVWVLVTYKFFRQPLDSFKLEFEDKSDTGIIYSEDLVKMKFYSKVVEKPELVEFYIPLSKSYVKIVNYKVISSVVYDDEYLLTLAPFENLPLSRLPYYNVKASIYWLNIEVNTFR